MTRVQKSQLYRYEFLHYSLVAKGPQSRATRQISCTKDYVIGSVTDLHSLSSQENTELREQQCHIHGLRSLSSKTDSKLRKWQVRIASLIAYLRRLSL
jgi:hypothetical protein